MRRGFTLVELLVVVAVVAILIGILAPALARSRIEARKATTLARLRDLGIATASYMIDFEGEGPSVGDEDNKAFLGLSVLAWYTDVPAQAFVNVNTDDTPGTLDEHGERLVLARLGDVPIDDGVGVTMGEVAQIVWSCSFSYDPDLKSARARKRYRVYLGDRADYEHGVTRSANWAGEGQCCLWTDQHAAFVATRCLPDQDDPNMYHHNESGGEGGEEVTEGVSVTDETADTHLRFFSEEEDDELLPE